VSEAPPPAAGSARFDKKGVLDRSGIAHLVGSYTCSNASFFGVSGSLTQTRGPVSVRGSFGAPDTPICDGRQRRLDVAVFEDEGNRFAPGQAVLEFNTIVCSVTGCDFSP
jgi:hypothetical protein